MFMTSRFCTTIVLGILLGSPHANAQLTITEFMADNKATLADEDGTFSDWVEIHNAGGAPVSLNGWHLTDNAGNLTKWRFPATNIAAGGYLVVWASNKDRTNPGAPLHTSWALSAGGEYLGLVMPDGATIVSEYAPGFPEQFADISYGILNGSNAYFGTPTPGAPNSTNSLAFVAETQFSHGRGFYTNAFNLAITTTTAGAVIRYTTNGSPPSLTNGTVYSAPVPINKTAVIRAGAFRSGFVPSRIVTHSYIFLDDVIWQSTNGLAPPGWPASWGANRVDYGMDLKVLNDPRYGVTIKDDLKAIPTISLVMKLEDLFDPTNGIYANSTQSGPNWERPASLELIYPEGTEGFQVNAGLRIRGNFSASSTYPKHSFRGFFRGQYGDKSLKYPLFGDSGTDSFPGGVDLATFQNHAWSNWGNPGGTNALFLRDHFGRDTQLAMGHQGERGIYTHLYINGQYWGIYSPSERPEASFAATYYGGREEDYDVVKATGNVGGYGIEATDGDMAAWARLWQYATNGFASATAYQRVQGNNPDGSRNPAYDILVDVENLIDYQLIVAYTGSRDAPVGASGTTPNNWYGIYRRDGTMGFRFFVHDFEHSLLDVNENRIGPYIAGSPGAGGGLPKSSPQYIWQQLQQNDEFRMRVADHVHRHFFNGGVLTVEACLARFQERTNQLHHALVGESARWGDADPNHNIAYTRDGYWLPLVSRMLTNYLPQRSGIVLNQLKAKNLYPNVVAPSFSQHGGNITNGFDVTITAPAGTIYYTLDGSDPRLPGGGISPTALDYTAPIVLVENGELKARVLSGATWSAVNEATFTILRDFTDLLITEIMYHPPDIGEMDGNEFEFIELKNVALTNLDLSGVQFVNGISYTFPNGTILEPGEFIVLVGNPAAFATKYPEVPIAGVYTGKLSNSGEQLRLVHAAGATIVSLTFSDKAPWPVTPDGGGFSLVPKNPNLNPDANSAANWRASANPGGSPGADDPTPNIAPILINEILTHTDPPLLDAIELFNPTTNAVNIGHWWLTDKRTNPLQFRIPAGTLIPANGYLVFTETNFNANPDSPTNFSFSSHGEEVYLYSADVAGNLTGYSHGFSFGAAENGVSFGRHVTSTGESKYPAQLANTLEGANAGPRVGPVVINEIRYKPLPGDEEFIELKNISGGAVKLFDPLHPANTWKLNGVGFSFPTGVEIPAGGMVVVAATDPVAFRAHNNVPVSVPVFGPYAGVLQNDGELLQLQRPDAPDTIVPYITVDEVRYSNKPPWPAAAANAGSSLERINSAAYGNDPINWRARSHGATPGAENNQNLAPWVSAGANQSFAATNFPATVLLEGMALDDGYPALPGALSISWSQISGPATATFSQTDQAETAVHFPKAGTYVLRLTAADGELQTASDVTVTIERVTYPITLIPPGAVWKYLDDGSDQGSAWRTPGFNDFAWASGPAKLGYGGDGEVTVVNSGPSGSRIITTYFRRQFVLAAAENVTALTVRLLRDDGGVVYLNGTEVFRSNLPDGPITYTNRALLLVSGDAEHAFFETNAPPGLLVNGTNLLAVEIHQIHQTGTDMGFNLELIGSSWGTNQPPQVFVGDDFAIRLPQSAGLSGIAFDDGLPLAPGMLSMHWSKTSGPGQVIFADTNAPVTTADFSRDGVYTLRLSADDGALGAAANVTVYVLPETFASWAGAYFSSNQLADPDISGANADPDGDSFTNGEEFVAGTNPLDRESHLHIEQIRIAGDGVLLQFTAAPRRTYSVQSGDALGGAWTTLTNLPADTRLRTVEMSNSPHFPSRYYRLVAPAQ